MFLFSATFVVVEQSLSAVIDSDVLLSGTESKLFLGLKFSQRMSRILDASIVMQYIMHLMTTVYFDL